MSKGKKKVTRHGKACTKARGRLKKGCRWLRGHGKRCSCKRRGRK